MPSIAPYSQKQHIWLNIQVIYLSAEGNIQLVATPKGSFFLVSGCSAYVSQW